MRLHIFNLLVLIAFCSLARAEEVTFRVIDPQNSAVPGATIDIRGTHAIPKVLCERFSRSAQGECRASRGNSGPRPRL